MPILRHVLDGEYAAALRCSAALQMLRAGLPCSCSAPQDLTSSADALAQYFSSVAAAAADSSAELQLLVAVAALYLFMQANMTGYVMHA